MARVLRVVVGVIVVAYAVNFANSFFGSGRTVEEPREISSDRITPPGTELRVGEEAFVPHRDTRNGRDRDGIVAITVASIEEGDQELFHRSVENAEGMEAYYIRSTVENVSREDLGTAVFSIDLVQSDGSPTGFVIFDGDVRNPGFGDCRGQNFPTYAELGTIIETCEIGGVRGGQVPGGARYGPADTAYFDPPIIWRE
jgi:hypothetical protein